MPMVYQISGKVQLRRALIPDDSRSHTQRTNYYSGQTRVDRGRQLKFYLLHNVVHGRVREHRTQHERQY